MKNEEISPPTYHLPGLLILLVGIFVIAIVLNKPRTEENKNWSSSWKLVSSFTTPRRAHAAVAVNGYLYVIGGVNNSQQYPRAIEFAKILPNGELTQWQTTSPLQQGRFYLSAVHSNGYLYAIGGGTGQLGGENQPVITVEKAKILTDGSLGPWSYESDLTTPRRGLKAVALNGKIFALGGYNGTFLKTIESANIQHNGTLSNWGLEKHSSKVDRYIHSLAKHKNTLYLLGGHVQKNDLISYGDVEMTNLGNTNEINEWQIEASRLLNPRFIASAFVLKRWLYILGGHNGANRLNSVEFTTIQDDNHVTNWKFTTQLNQARSATAVAVYNNRVLRPGRHGQHPHTQHCRNGRS